MTGARRATLAMALVALAQVWLVSAVPLQVLAHAAHDDALFARLAISLLSGDWLGPYDPLTFSKGPFYPMWLAAVAWLGLPLLLAQDLLYLFAGALLLRLLAPRPRRWWLVAGLYAAYAFNPMLTAGPDLRIIREGLYTPLVVLLVAMVVWWWRWRDRELWRRALPALMLGAVFASFWLTREEGPWMFPPLAVAALFCALCGSRSRRVARLARESALVALAVLVAWSASHAVALANKAHYGVAMVVETRDAAFVGAYGAMSRIQHAAWRQHVQVPREVLRRAGEHSPAVAELLPWLDGALADGWAIESCYAFRGEPCDGEIHTGWFMWALRDAIDLAGHYASAEEARRFYRRLAEEVDAACDDGRLACLAPRQTMLPPFRQAYLPLAAGRFVDAFAMLARLDSAGPAWLESSGRVIDYRLVSNLVGGPVFPRGRNVWLRGLLLTPDIRVDHVAVGGGDGTVWHTVELTERARYEDGTVAVKFDLNTNCVAPDCRLLIHARYSLLASVRFDALGERVEAGPVTLILADILDSRDRLAPRDRRTDSAFAILATLSEGWRAVAPALAALALAGFLAAVALGARARRLGTVTFVAGVLLAAVASRLALLAYLDVVAMPGLTILYLSPIVPPWILFLGLAPAAAVEAWQARNGGADDDRER